MARNNGVLKDDSDLFDNKYGKLYCYDLPIAVLGNNYIKGKKYNHEEYLVDFINHSRLVKDKGGIFKHQKSQSNSECDAINNTDYGIDFKRFSGSNLMEAKVITSEDVYEMNGLIVYAVSEHNKKKYDYYDMFESIQMNPSLLTSKINTKDKNLLEDIELVKKLLSTKKNLMIFLPYEFEFYQVDTDEVVAKQIVSLFYI